MTYVLGTLLALPSFVLAATAPTNLKELVSLLIGIIKTLVFLVFALTFLAFTWGMVKGWIVHGGDAEGVTEGKNVAMVGIIALVIMVSIWGLLSILRYSLFGA